MAYNEVFMHRAIELSILNIEEGGGPFGAVIVKNDNIIAEGVNSVVSNLDPTAHAEINVIREAAKHLGVFNLSGCDIYSSCEPCPMCLSAIYWAHIDNLYYGNTKTDAKEIGFDDSFIYDEINLHAKKRHVKAKQCLSNKAIIAFEKWRDKKDKMIY